MGLPTFPTSDAEIGQNQLSRRARLFYLTPSLFLLAVVTPQARRHALD